MKPLHCKHSECATTERSYASIRLCIEGLFENEQTCITTLNNCFDMMKPLHCKHNECARTERSYASIELCIKDLFRNEQSHIATVSNCCEMKTKFTFSSVKFNLGILFAQYRTRLLYFKKHAFKKHKAQNAKN